MVVVGTKDNPYSKAQYDELVSRSEWPGGWVSWGYELVYVTSNGHVEKKVGNREVGSESNPFTEQAYWEMNCKNEWVGGYVLFEGCSQPSYRYASGEEEYGSCGCGGDSSCGCGCGYGGGFGCGSGKPRLVPGSEILSVAGRYAGEDGHYKVKVSWDAESKVSAQCIGFYKSTEGGCVF